MSAKPTMTKATMLVIESARALVAMSKGVDVIVDSGVGPTLRRVRGRPKICLRCKCLW